MAVIFGIGLCIRHEHGTNSGSDKQYPDLIFIGYSQPFWHEISGDASADLDSRNSWGKGRLQKVAS